MERKKHLKKIIDRYAITVATTFLEAAKKAKSEEDLRQYCNSILNRFVSEAGLNIEARNEAPTPDGGRIDTRYGDVLIEYKDPNSPTQKITSSLDAPGTKAVVQQLKSRFEAFRRENPELITRLFGVGLDGDTIVYLWWRSGEYKVTVLPVTAEFVKRLLEAIASVAERGKEFTPNNLAEDFGAGSNVALNCVKALYEHLIRTEHPKTKTLFKQWELLFGEVCGYDIEGKTGKLDELASTYHIDGARPAELLFSVQTYYSIFMKLLAIEVISAFTKIGFSIIDKCSEAATSEGLREVFRELEDGSIWRSIGYINFIEGNLFSWYVDVWDSEISNALRMLISKLGDYDTTTISSNPVESRDLLKRLYHELLPRKVRHDLGEFYTPDWLAEYVLDEIGYDGNPDKRLLDPACGSGTFLVMAIKRVMKWYNDNIHTCGFGKKELVRKITKNIIGFDLNPLAVLASRANYIIAIRELLRAMGGFEIPVYLCDSVVTPTQREDLFKKQFLELKIAPFETPLRIPREVAESRQILGKYADIMDSCISGEYSADEFIERLKNRGIEVVNEGLHVELYNKLMGLANEGKNGVWARVIKNAFAPVFVEKVDFIAGNPPWINWESLPEEYRNSLIPLYEHHYGLFPIKGQQRRLGSSKIDLSSLFVYVCADEYLKKGGKLGFVITQSLFKTKGAGQGFRRWKLPEGKGYIKPLRVTDMSDFQPFEGATNRTAVFVCKKSTRPFKYPVPYIVWKKAVRGKISPELMLDEVKRRVKRIRMDAIPVDPENPTSPWLTAPKKALPAILKVIGKSDYEAHAGVYTGGVNGVYWIEVLKELPNGDLIIRNLANVGKKKVKQVEAVIEPDFVYPLLRGRDVQRWRAKPSCHIIMVHDPIKRIGYPEREMKIKYPKTYAYLKRFEDVLRRRASSSVRALMDRGPFYSMFAVGEYTMAEWKVVWADMGDYVAPAVVSKERSNLVLPEHHVMFVSLDNPQEAHFICAVLSSSISMITSWAYTTSYGKSAHLVENISIPRFDPSNKIHLRLSELSRLCHEAAEAGDEDSIKRYEREIDILAAKIWGITDEELAGVWEVMGN